MYFVRYKCGCVVLRLSVVGHSRVVPIIIQACDRDRDDNDIGFHPATALRAADFRVKPFKRLTLEETIPFLSEINRLIMLGFANLQIESLAKYVAERKRSECQESHYLQQAVASLGLISTESTTTDSSKAEKSSSPETVTLTRDQE